MSRLIKHKKVHYGVGEQLSDYLKKFGRTAQLPLTYEDLLDFNETMAVYDKDDNPTLWQTCIYPTSISDSLEKSLTKIYSQLIAGLRAILLYHQHTAI